ncbi:fibroblast growth factor 23 [Lepisosteus oculatus]|uniref:fibroblast growth factor 23 n=1 Tax=Lepisosteus oculatus TaxID=7918 RepID=UPI000740049B|nr:PREDICTED: fibroblast growth factor 23 [Lepisosteus oculatus]
MWSAASRPNMHSCFLALCLAVLQGLKIVHSFPNPSPLLSSNWGNPKRYVHLQTSSETRSFYLEIDEDGQVGKTATQNAFSVLLLKAETRDRLAIFGVKSKRFLCMDAEGKTFTSTICNKEDCLFHHKLLENNQDVYYSCKNNLVLNLEGVKHIFVPGQNLPAYSLFLSEKNTIPLEHLLHRDKRNGHVGPLEYISHSDHVDPSDPLALFKPRNIYYGETSDSRAINTNPEHGFNGEAHVVSRESLGPTYNEEVDPNDPLRLLEPRENFSPRYFQNMRT